MKRLLAGFSVAVMMTAACAAAPPPRPLTQQEVAASFNTAALDANYPSCALRQQLRRQNMRAPFTPGSPAYFLPRATEFVILSEKLTQAERAKARELFGVVPQHVKDLAYSQGAIYMMPRHGIAEPVPALADDPGYYNDLGLYIALERRAYIPFENARLGRRADGTLRALAWTPTARDQKRMINHESGHMMDDLLGQYSVMDATGANGDKRLTNRADFLAAYASDLAALKRRHRDFGWRGYYFPKSYNGKAIGGAQEDEQRARREAFAELWAEAQGYSETGLSRFYPAAFAVVKGYSDFLKAEGRRQEAQCRYTMDGQAQPR
jgi:hypothetical protein